LDAEGIVLLRGNKIASSRQIDESRQDAQVLACHWPVPDSIKAPFSPFLQRIVS